MPRRKSALHEAIDAARRGMLDTKSSPAVRLRYLDRFCVLNKLLNVSLEDKDSDKGGIKPEDIEIPSLTSVKEALAKYDAKKKSDAEAAEAAAPSPEFTALNAELTEMLKPATTPVAATEPTYKGYSDIALMRNEHMTPKDDPWD